MGKNAKDKMATTKGKLKTTAKGTVKAPIRNRTKKTKARQTAQLREAPPATVNSNGTGRQGRTVNDLIYNALQSRAQLISRLSDPRRDIDDECGYPATPGLTARMFKDYYDRESVATRVVEVLPRESWQAEPSIIETVDADEKTAFEIAWEEVAQHLQGSSWYKAEEGNPIWEHLLRGDILSGIGSFGVLLLGIDDGKKLSEPAEGINERGEQAGSQSGRKLMYVRAFDESLVQITKYETDKENPRYGQPVEYNLTLYDISSAAAGSPLLPSDTHTVHWSRVIHLADNLRSSEVIGTSRLRPVFNNVFNVRKLSGGSAEMYWRGAFPGLSIETHPQLGGDVEINATAMREQMEQYMNGLQRYMALTGMSAKSLAPQVVDPTPQINVQIMLICIRLGIPLRIFMGSERGQLASSQDDRTWNDRLRDRQSKYIVPRIIVPFIDRLIMLGVLPRPESYDVVWPALDTLSETEQAEVAVKRAEAMAKYVGGNVEAIMAPLDFYTRILGMTQEEATAIIEAQEEAEPLLIPSEGIEEEETGEELTEEGEE